MTDSSAQHLQDSFENAAIHCVNNEHGSREIPYRAIQGYPGTGVFVIPGFGHGIWEPKADFLYDKCRTNDHNFLAFSYSGLDAPGRTIQDFSLVRWLDDTRIMFDVAQGPQIVVASSFGATSALQLASDYPERVRGLILIAPGTDLEAHMLRPLLSSDKRRAEYEQAGYFMYPISHRAGRKIIKVTQNDIAGGQAQEVFRGKNNVSVNCPVIIIHDAGDNHVPHADSRLLQDKIKAPTRPRVITALGGGHELNQRRGDLQGIWSNTKILLDRAGPG